VEIRDNRELAPTTGVEGEAPKPGAWQSLATMSWVWLTAGLVASALFAGGVALFSTDPRHRLWGQAAVGGYALAAIAVAAWRSRGTRGIDVALGAMLCGAILFPLLWLIAHGFGEPEVGVVATSAHELIHDGTPYQSTQALAATTNPNQYNPYLPLMAVFGVPQALLGHELLTDPRVWFGAVFLATFAVALRIAGARDGVRWALLLTASPIIAFELCVGGTDVPMVAFMCLGFALLWREQGAYLITAGLALGVASAMKATAWPALIIAFALVYTRHGRRAAWQLAAVAVSVVLVIVGPFAVLRPTALVKNTILFPLGLASVKSQADSPLLGHVLAQTGVLGHTIVLILLIGSGVAIAVSLVVRPPRDVPAATLRLVLGLSAMFVLAPSTRFGYFIYPAAMVLWLLASQAGRKFAEHPQPEVLIPG
jgi:4-amino-4-deoxy-L-arabinose transferase-like glycosyltransferase